MQERCALWLVQISMLYHAVSKVLTAKRLPSFFLRAQPCMVELFLIR